MDLGFVAVPPGDPLYPLYLEALAKHERNPPPEPEPPLVANTPDPWTIWLPFQKNIPIPSDA